MKARYGVLAGIGIGYVLGAKAGRARYEQIKERWQAMAESPAVQQVVEPVKEAVEPVLDKVEEMVEGRTGTEDHPTRGLASLSADQMKERLARTGSVSEPFQTHPPEEIIKERM
jgi:hypothetical protein